MIEQVGSQYRIRILSPELFVKSSFRTKDVGIRGGLQLILGKLKKTGKWTVQALRLSIHDFSFYRKTLYPITKRGARELKFVKGYLFR
jgi:predicted acetyltransferase